LIESVKRIQRAGLEVQRGFIVGFDIDTPSIFQRQIDFIQKSGIVTAPNCSPWPLHLQFTATISVESANFTFYKLQIAQVRDRSSKK
jgi:hypothetical protein